MLPKLPELYWLTKMKNITQMHSNTDKLGNIVKQLNSALPEASPAKAGNSLL